VPRKFTVIRYPFYFLPCIGLLLAFAFILLAIWIWILVSVYSIFFPFMKNLGEIGNYNTAYYGAISSVERWELVLKYRAPGFEGSGGYISGTNRWPQSDYKTWLFGFVGTDPNGMRWTIRSRTENIPNTGEGNVEYLLADTSSVDYNELDYNSAEKIILSYDNTTDAQQYYSGWSNLSYYNGTITWTLRLPPKVQSGLMNENLCETCDLDGDGLGDDIVVDRSLEGNQEWMYFKIVPYVGTLYYSWTYVDTSKDIALRESVINATGNLDFNQYSPINGQGNGLTGHVVIANNPSAVAIDTFGDILWNNTTYTWLMLNLWLINLLKTVNGNIYPFLEYRLHFNGPVADRFYTIQGNGRVGEYDVQVVVKKPTSQWSIAWSFTVIF